MMTASSVQRLIPLVLLMMAVCLLRAQPEWAFSGYVVNLPVYQAAVKDFDGSSRNLFLDLNRLRLRPVFYLGENTRLQLEYEADFLWQEEAGLLSALPQKTNRQRYSWRWTPVSETNTLVTHYIDRLYLRQDFSFGNVVIGRQRVSWGTGRIWNPTDLFSPINPASFDKIEKDGADLLSSKIYLGNFTDLILVVNPQSSWARSNGGFRFRSNYRGYDFALVGGYFDERLVMGGDFAGNLFDAGVRGEWLLSADKDNLAESYLKWIAGIDYQFTPRLYALAEYQFNGQGNRNPRDYDLLALLSGTILNLNRHYLFAQATYQIHPLLNSALGYNANLVDESGFWVLTFIYSAATNVDIVFGGQAVYGPQLSEYWLYPSSFFLQGEFHF